VLRSCVGATRTAHHDCAGCRIRGAKGPLAEAGGACRLRLMLGSRAKLLERGEVVVAAVPTVSISVCVRKLSKCSWMIR
jgi:hypothetical protein